MLIICVSASRETTGRTSYVYTSINAIMLSIDGHSG